MTLLMNPMALRMGLLLFAAITAFGLGLFTIRLLRKNLVSESESLNSRSLGGGGIARARLSRRHSATEAAKA